MKTEWVRIAPYVKWGLPGGIFGAAIGGAVPAFMGSDSAPWAWVGLPFGMAIGALAIHVKISKDRASKDVVERVAAEHRDPKVVPKMYGDVESGYETAAWHAIGLLANYRNPVITRNMLQMVDNRLHNKQVTTLDRLGLVRHAIKCVQATASQSNIEQLRPFASDPDSEVGVMIRRMRADIKEFTLK